MKQSIMANKFVDKVNELMDNQDITKAALSRQTGIDKNSLGMYLNKDRNISFDAVLKIADYFNLDISNICGIKTERVLTENEIKLIKTIRLTPEHLQEPTILSLIDIVNLIKINK